MLYLKLGIVFKMIQVKSFVDTWFETVYKESCGWNSAVYEFWDNCTSKSKWKSSKY